MVIFEKKNIKNEKKINTNIVISEKVSIFTIKQKKNKIYNNKIFSSFQRIIFLFDLEGG